MSVDIREDVHSREITLKVLGELFDEDDLAGIAVRLWDGTQWPDEAARPATLKLNHPGALRAFLLPGTEVGLVEAYLYDDVDFEGDIEEVFVLADVLAEKAANLRTKIAIGRDLLRLPNQPHVRETKRGPAQLEGKPHSIERDRQAIAYHYNVSNDFYKLFLDQRMVYSCAYFRTSQDSLNTAQEQKLDLICRKLGLRPGMRVLDIGCGWGGMVIHAAQKYGVDATGITLSQPQADLANQRIREAGLQDQARVQVMDYREIDEPEGFDALVSVGMFEHVGADLLPVYFERAFQLLKPGGLFLNHGIARSEFTPPDSPDSFSNAYVFPDGELETISFTLQAAEESHFEVRDVESLREHYARTLRHWVSNLEGNHDQALAYVEEPTFRVWRIFMSYSAFSFTRGTINVYQSLLAKQDQNGKSGTPLNREAWYVR